MVLSSSSRSPMTTTELSMRHGTSGMLIRAGPDHSCVTICSHARIAATVIKSSRAALCSFKFHTCRRCTPSPHWCAHLAPYATIVMGANAMHHLPDKARANHLNPGLVTLTSAGLIHGRDASQRMGPVAASPVIHKWWRTLLRRVTNQRQRRWPTCRNGCVFQTVMLRHMCIEHVLFWIVLTRAIIVKQVITNCATGTPILHVEASFTSVERGLRRGISSWTSLKCYI